MLFLASVVPWRSFNIHKTFPLHKKFYRRNIFGFLGLLCCHNKLPLNSMACCHNRSMCFQFTVSLGNRDFKVNKHTMINFHLSKNGNILDFFSVLHLLPKAEQLKCMCWFPSRKSVGGEFWRSDSRPWNEKLRAQMVSLSMYFPRLNSLWCGLVNVTAAPARFYMGLWY